MAKYCEICGKGSNNANRIRRRGKAKKKGGVGRNVTSVTSRTQKPNLQKVKAIVDGKKQKVTVCSKCLKAGKVQRAY